MPVYGGYSVFDSEVESVTSELNAKEDLPVMKDLCQRCQHLPNGAKDLLRSIAKRLNDKDPHVAIQALTLLDVGVVYGGMSFRQEISSRDFISECRTLITNGKTHTKVIKRLKHLIHRWAENEFKSNPSLSLIPSLFNSLRSEGHSFPIDEQAINIVASQEDDNLARAIALSLKDSSGKSVNGISSSASKALRQVRALYDFEAAEDNELTFTAGELINILDDSDSNWWKGCSNRGEGLFPANFVTADLTADLDSETSLKSRKSVRFQEHVDVKVLDTTSADVIEIDQSKIDEALRLIQNADPTQDNESDPPELSTLEEQCRSMGPLIDQELEAIDRHCNAMAQVNGQLLEAFAMYHSLMQQSSYSAAPSIMPSYQSLESHQAVPMMSSFSQLPIVPPLYMAAGFSVQPGPPQAYQPMNVAPQHVFVPPGGTTVVGQGNVL